ncbi:MAG: hypothetical protein CM1200mP25_3020 [Acidobacteriota bacterium]|nr:MAG: hypothetical protein CM1200mP25_3020 [Acidobacteriota bacterium]
MTTLDQKVTQLRDLLASFKNVVVCFSGGVDSTYLLSEAVQVLGRRRPFDSHLPSLARRRRAVKLPTRLGSPLSCDTYELDAPRYAETR